MAANCARFELKASKAHRGLTLGGRFSSCARVVYVVVTCLHPVGVCSLAERSGMENHSEPAALWNLRALDPAGLTHLGANG